MEFISSHVDFSNTLKIHHLGYSSILYQCLRVHLDVVRIYNKGRPKRPEVLFK